jgi:hypothetical protein
MAKSFGLRTGKEEKMVDQAISNSIGLRDDFLGKVYGIAADCGFTFNKKDEQNKTITATPLSTECDRWHRCRNRRDAELQQITI